MGTGTLIIAGTVGEAACLRVGMEQVWWWEWRRTRSEPTKLG